MSKASLHKISLFFLFVLLFSFYIYRSVLVMDPDFGWRLRIGQIILKSGVPKTDPFSYTMSHYPVVDHEWLINTLTAVVYPYLGMAGLAIIFAGIAVVALYISIRLVPLENRKWAGIPIFLAGTTLLSFVAVRAQVLTWLFLAVFLHLLLNDRFKKVRFFTLPFLFMIWANLHGGFASGIVFLGLLSILDLTKKNTKTLLVFLMSAVATFINPYGIRLWWEIYMSISDAYLRSAISEWTPSYDMPNFMFWAFVSLSVILVTHYRLKYSASHLMLYFVSFLMSMSSKRHIPLWIIIALPMTIAALNYLSIEAKKVLYGKRRFLIAYKGLFLVCILIFFINGYVMYFSFLSATEELYYPVAASEYLRTHTLSGNLWSPYDWNGYLVWKVPGLKVFIHGMMPSWRNHNYPGESEYALAEYNKLLGGEIPLSYVMREYDIRAVMVPSESMDESFFKDRKLGFSSIGEQILKLKFKELYRDEKVIIYSK